ncbi:hypothetical protein [Streptomyces sp. NPDC088736]|uniref:hypothetical protein n=1 Tax=Streptomyces sp. NPDC088736 TaxID=3365881 RepID=UPI003803DD43
MKIFVESLPELLGALGSAGVLGTLAWCCGIWRRRLGSRHTCAAPEAIPRPELDAQFRAIRRYTLLGTASGDGGAVQVMSTRLAGAILVWPVGDRQERFELTDVQLFDGSFAAEPVDRYEKVP